MWYNKNRARHGSPRQSSNDPTQSSHRHRGFPGGSLRVSLTHGSIRHSLGSSFKSVVQGKHRRSYLQESQHSGSCRNGHRSPQSASTLAVRSLGGWSKDDGRSSFVCMGCWHIRSYFWNWLPRDFHCSVGLHHSTSYSDWRPWEHPAKVAWV